eukprot:UN12789
MALISEIYTDSDEDDDMTMQCINDKNNEESKESKQTIKSTKPLPQPLPPKKISRQKKGSFTSYKSSCMNDNRGPNNENYTTQQMPIKKRRELHKGFIPKANQSLFNKGMYNPVISKKGQTQNKNNQKNKAKNPF